jgi:steroid delta-isomerase-like uncharacterized protein
VTTTEALRADRLRQVDQHVALENLHDLDAVMETFGSQAAYDDEPWDEHFRDPGGVRAHYERLLSAVPDLHIEPIRRHVTDDVVVLECMITGTHEGLWHGLPATGRRISIPVCAVYTFDDDAALAGERIYYDVVTVLQQLGVFHPLESARGRITTALMHPLTMLRVATRMARGRRRA